MVIFDLEVLADSRHRKYLLNGPTYNRHQYSQMAIYDKPFIIPINRVLSMIERGEEVEIWTTRSELYREQAEVWLNRYGIPPFTVTHYRSYDDMMPGHLLKEEWYLDLIKGGKVKVDRVFDSDKDSIDMWSRHDVTCFDYSKEERKVK